MSTPSDDGDPQLRYAEYVLGVLDADERAQVEREMAASESAAAAVERWRRRLLPLAEEATPESPAGEVWQRIREELQIDGSRRPAGEEKRQGVWESPRFWRRLSLATGMLFAAACLVLVVLVLPRPAPPAVPYMAATINQTGGRAGWTATMDLGKARMVVVPASPESIGAGRSPELWLIPAGGKPLAVGVISATAPITIPLTPTLLAQLGPTATLAVSVEPSGGSPTGQPTGPVIAQGKIGAAAAAGNAPLPATALSLPRSARLGA
jgi:anti-sigma-K factor RskA